MTREELKAWLETLKPGDKVAFPRSRGFYAPSWEILTVERTTQTQIMMQSTERFRKSDGQEVGSSSWSNIQPVTDGIRAKIHRQNIIARFKGIPMKPDNYTTEQLEAVIEILTNATQPSDSPPELG